MNHRIYNLKSDEYIPVINFLNLKKIYGKFFYESLDPEMIFSNGFSTRRTIRNIFVDLFGGTSGTRSVIGRFILQNQTYYSYGKSIFVVENNNIKFLIAKMIKGEVANLSKLVSISGLENVVDVNGNEIPVNSYVIYNEQLPTIKQYINNVAFYINPELFTNHSYTSLKNKFLKNMHLFSSTPMYIELDIESLIKKINSKFVSIIPNIETVEQFDGLINNIRSKLPENNTEYSRNSLKQKLIDNKVIDDDNNIITEFNTLSDTSIIEGVEFPEMETLNLEITPLEVQTESESVAYIYPGSTHVVKGRLEICSPALQLSDDNYIVAIDRYELGYELQEVVINVSSLHDEVIFLSNNESLVIDTLNPAMAAANAYKALLHGVSIENVNIFVLEMENQI